MDLDHHLVDLVADHCWESDPKPLELGPFLNDLKEAVIKEIHRRRDEREKAWMKKTRTIFENEYIEKYDLDSKQWSVILDHKIIPSYPEATPSGRRCYRDKKPTKAQLKKIADNTYYSTKQAAEYLDISTSTFTKLRKQQGLEPKDPPWQPAKDSVRGCLRYDANFYLKADLDELDVQVKPRKISQALLDAWDELNKRQRTYLEVIYEIERGKAKYYESPDSMFDEKRKGGEWRWVLHHSDEARRGIDLILKRHGMLDSGTGSTYAALERKGHIETRYEEDMLILDLEILWVKLTKSGRRLIKAMTG